MLLNDPDFDDEIFRSLKKIAYGGAPMPPALLDELMQRFPGLELANNYGQTETCPLSMFRADLAPDRVATLGRAPKGIEVAILSPEGEPLPPGEIGEIASRGEHNMRGYYNDPEQTEAWYRNGWGCTGDLGVMDEEGYISLVDRARDMVISGGENIYPKEIENVLHRHPAVAECAVFGVPDDTWGEVVAAHICLRHNESADTADLQAFCEQNLARFKLPKILQIVDDLPKTAIGKIQKNILRDMYLQS
jgi:acyl-CoA synthetase (AMP-forming)/AMP-acid ligase II